MKSPTMMGGNKSRRSKQQTALEHSYTKQAYTTLLCETAPLLWSVMLGLKQVEGSGKRNQAIARLNMEGENSVAIGHFCCRDQGAME